MKNTKKNKFGNYECIGSVNTKINIYPTANPLNYNSLFFVKKNVVNQYIL